MRAKRKKIVLTDAQFQFLTNLTQRPQTAVEYYAPAKGLLALGFATSEPGPFTHTYTITEAGRAHHHAVMMAPKTCHSCKTAPWTCRVCKRKTCEHYCRGKNGADMTALCGRASCSK